MTDEAIGLLIEANDRARSLGFVTGTTNWAGVLAKAVAAQPDCRTCRQFHWSQFTEDYRCHFIQEGGSCVNGDKHFAVPSVVLWRTE